MSDMNETAQSEGPVTTEVPEGQLIDEVVTALTNPPEGEGDVVMSLKDQLQRAADEYDMRAAETFGSALVNSLCEDPGDVRRLEALLILGLAHPAILDLYKVSLTTEGRRLCILLENLGETERARGLLEMLATRLPEDRELQQDLASMMRRCGDVAELVDRCLKRAEEAVEKGRPMDAIPWLQEVLLHDQTRRDVARMIRDLRYQEMENTAHSRKRNRLVGVLVALSMMLSVVLVRESSLNTEYKSLPAAVDGDQTALKERIQAIDDLIASNHLWIGMFGVVSERNELRSQADRLAAKQAERERRQAAEASERRVKAEAQRLAAIDAVMGGKYAKGKELFQNALGLAADDWPRRERVLLDIAAIDDLLNQRN